MIAGLARTLFLAWAAGGENRLWFVDLELRGACAEVLLDCGPDGETRFLGPFAHGEHRRASVPVPVRSPLGAEGLTLVPLPRARVLPEGAGATVEVLGWSAPQPAADLERHGLLLARPRPPVAPVAPRAAWPELALVGIAGVFLLRFRRRPRITLLLALGAGLAAFELARSRPSEARGERILEWEAGGTLALSVRVDADETALPRGRLEVVPEGRRLEFVWRSAGAGTGRARGARLTAVEGTAIPALAPVSNGGEALAEVWTRSSGGAWSARGPWPRGEPLGNRVGERAADPPGWLASGLPPGRAVLLGRTASGEWLRCLGFEPE